MSFPWMNLMEEQMLGKREGERKRGSRSRDERKRGKRDEKRRGEYAKRML